MITATWWYKYILLPKRFTPYCYNYHISVCIVIINYTNSNSHFFFASQARANCANLTYFKYRNQVWIQWVIAFAPIKTQNVLTIGDDCECKCIFSYDICMYIKLRSVESRRIWEILKKNSLGKKITPLSSFCKAHCLLFFVQQRLYRLHDFVEVFINFWVQVLCSPSLSSTLMQNNLYSYSV